MSSPLSQDVTDEVPSLRKTKDTDIVSPPDIKTKTAKNWVQFDDETPPDTPARLKPPERVEKPTERSPVIIRPDSVIVNVDEIVNADIDESKESSSSSGSNLPIEKHKGNEYSGAVISTESVHINLDRSGLNRSLSSDSPEQNLPSDVRVSDPKSASLKTIDLRDASSSSSSSNGRTVSNVVNTPIGNIRQGFANGDTIVTLLPVNTKWPWVTPAKFRPELVPEELMAQGLTVRIYS